MTIEQKSSPSEQSFDFSEIDYSSALWNGFQARLSRLSVMGARFEASYTQSALDAYIAGIGLIRLTHKNGNSLRPDTLSAQRLSPETLSNSVGLTSSTEKDITSRK